MTMAGNGLLEDVAAAGEYYEQDHDGEFDRQQEPDDASPGHLSAAARCEHGDGQDHAARQENDKADDAERIRANEEGQVGQHSSSTRVARGMPRQDFDVFESYPSFPNRKPEHIRP